jgi:L-threonylcarbamoyladenylate synthase
VSAVLPCADPLDEALARLRAGGLVAYPTETVFGLAADARNAEAVARLRAWKGRHGSQPLAVLVTGLAAAEFLGIRVTPLARRIAAAFWPGPLTLVLCAGALLAPGVARADGAVGLRCSSHPLAAALAARVERAGIGPVTATSLNRSGAPPARDLAAARRLCGPGLDVPWLLPGADAWGQPPSSVLDLAGPEPAVLREGAVDRAALASVLEARGGP